MDENIQSKLRSQMRSQNDKLWEDIYINRLETLLEALRGGATQFLQRETEIEGRSNFLSYLDRCLDQIVERLYTDNPNETYGKVPKRMDEQGLYKRVYQYYEEIDDPETETKIKKLLENPNPEEIKRVLRTRTGRSIAEELNLNIS